MTAHADLSNRQFLKNLGANLFGFGIAVVSGFFVTPFLVDRLGVAAFGLVPLTNSLVAFLGIVTVVLSSSISRFITVDVARGELERANRVFNTSFWASVALAAVVFLVGSIASSRAEALIAVPRGYEWDARLMFALATFTFGLSLLHTPFAAALFCANRVDVNAWLSIATRVVQLALGAGLVATLYRRPVAMMIGSLAGTLVMLTASVYYWRRFMPWSRIAWSLDRAILKQQLAFGLWNAVNTVGALLYMQIDLYVINRLLGAEQGGQYAALSQWGVLLRGLGGTVSAVFLPGIVHSYARGDSEGVVSYTRWAIRALGIFIALPVGLICGLASPLLTSWLGEDYARYGTLLALMVLPLSVNMAVYPLFAVQAAVNRVRAPAVVTCAMGGVNALLAVGLTPRLGMYGVALAGAIMLTAKNILFTPVYAARVLGRQWHIFFGEIVKIIIPTCAVAVAAFAASRWVALTTWPRLALATVLIGILYAAGVWALVLTSDERRQLRMRVLGLSRRGTSAAR